MKSCEKKENNLINKHEMKDLNYYKNNCEEDYIKTPISVLRYITELEKKLNIMDKVLYQLWQRD